MDIDKKNETEANNKPDVFMKTMLVIIAFLLLVIVIQQALPEKPMPLEQLSEECIIARELAEEMLLLINDVKLDLFKNYEDDVYGSGVSNINQQMFMVGEYQYMALHTNLLQNQVLLRVITACHW